MGLNETHNKIFVERLGAMPEALQELIMGDEVNNFVEWTASKYDLSEEQKRLLSNELVLTCLALEPLDQFARNLVSEIGMTQSNAKNVFKELVGSPLEHVVLFNIKVFAQSDEPSETVMSLVAEDGERRPKQDYLNEELVSKYKIPEAKVGAFTEVIEDIVLGFNKVTDLPRLLQTQVGLDQENARKLTAELIDQWEPIVAREEAEAKAKKDEVASLADKIAAIRPATPAEEDTQKETHEPAKLVRTMDADMAKHGYGAMTHSPSGNQVNLDTDETTIKSTPQDQLRPPQQ